MKEVKPEETKKFSRFTIKIVVSNVINLGLIIALIFILNRLPAESQKVKQLRSEQIRTQESASVGVLNAEINGYQDQIDQIDNVFVDEEGFVDFVTAIEAIRSQGILTEVSFPVSDPVEDEDGYLGLPVALVFRGSLDQINNSLEQVFTLPFLLKPVSSTIETSNVESYLLRLGLFLYVNEEFSQN